MISRDCPRCGKTFEYYPSSSRIYCSQKCSAAVNARANLGKYAEGRSLDLTCAQCGTTFRRYEAAIKSENHFCSRRCLGLWHRTHSYPRTLPGKYVRGKDHHAYKGMVERVCERCGQTFEKFPSQSINGQGRFCSRACTRNQIQVACQQCGKQLVFRASEANGRRFCNRVCKAEWQRHHNLGPDSPGWRGGYDPYYGPNWRNQRRAARKRDDFTCQRCGITEERLFKQLDVHHIIPFRTFGIERYKEANRLANLISLCHLCHLQVEPRN